MKRNEKAHLLRSGLGNLAISIIADFQNIASFLKSLYEGEFSYGKRI